MEKTMKSTQVTTFVEPFQAGAELHTDRRTWRLTNTPAEGEWFEIKEAQAEANRLGDILQNAVPAIEQWWPEIQHRLRNLRNQLDLEWQVHLDIDDAEFPEHLSPERATGMAHAMHLHRRRLEYRRNFVSRRVELVNGYEERLVEALQPALGDIDRKLVLQLARQCSKSLR
jgi:hypothetical protein